MKRLALSVCLTVLVLGIPIRAQAPAKPSPDYRELEAWAGNWAFHGYFKDNPSGSASKLDWSWEGRWRPGGRFLEIHGVLKIAGSEDQYLEILGYDPEKEAWAGYVFHNSGILATYACAFDELTCFENGEDRSPDGQILHWRHVWKFSPDRMSVSGICEAEADGTWWTVFEVKGVRSREKEAKRP